MSGWQLFGMTSHSIGAATLVAVGHYGGACLLACGLFIAGTDVIATACREKSK